MKETQYRSGLKAALAALLAMGALSGALAAQTNPEAASPPPSTGGIFPLSQVHRGLKATAWTVFTGTKPEPMEVEILGVLHGGRGPGHDMILAQLHGAKPEYTGVVAGMSGSPVYVGNKLMGSLSYRIGQFSKDPIAGITPIEQMLEVRDMPIGSADKPQLNRATVALPAGTAAGTAAGEEHAADLLQPMETPLLMSGFHPEAVKLWQEKMAGTGLDLVAAGGSGTSASAASTSAAMGAKAEPMASAADVLPGSAVSMQLVRGDLEIAATCTVTYIDPKQLLACGHPVLQAGPVSIPMTKTEVLATLASPLNAFKIINTGATIGSFTEDRDAAIRGVLGLPAHMIPVHVVVKTGDRERTQNVDVLDLQSLTPQAVLVSLYESLLQTNESTADMSYHVTGSIAMDGYPAAPIDVWASGGEALPAPLNAALQAADRFNRLYTNAARQGAIRAIDLNIDAIPHRMDVQLDSARLVSMNIAHPGDTVLVEATLRGWQQPERNVRIPVKLPARLEPGTLRILVSDAATLDRTMDQPKLTAKPADMDTTLEQLRNGHAADNVYVSLLLPETQAGTEGRTLSSLPLSMANAMEPLRTSQEVSLNGESAVPVARQAAGGVLSGFQILTLHVDPGSGVN